VVSAAALDREAILEILENVKDPEVPVLSVVELGIVRDVEVTESGVTVRITPTYSGCPAMRMIEDEIRAELVAHGISAVRLETIYQPAWTTDWLSPEAKRKLEEYGIAPPGRAPEQSLVSLTRAPSRVETPTCPYCHSRDTTIRSEFGSTACKAIGYCNGCEQPFEIFKAL
jgi:ring-1,2-phenylacetyl-CoA epoxidase subunit PaaD